MKRIAAWLQAMPLPMFRNSDGKPDAMLTAAAMALAVVLVKFALAGIVLAYGDKSVSVGPFDPLGAGSVLGPTFVSYVMRRNKDKSLAGGEGESK